MEWTCKMSLEICGRCTWCVHQSNLCLHKNKAVKPTHVCDETDHYGQKWFIEEKEDEKTESNN